MRINKEQYDAPVAKLDAIQGAHKTLAMWDTWTKAIEQGLDKLLQSHAALESRIDIAVRNSAGNGLQLLDLQKKLDALAKQQKEMFQNIHDRIELYSGFPEALRLLSSKLDALAEAIPAAVDKEIRAALIEAEIGSCFDRPAKKPAKRAKTLGAKR